jgi:hypothetical protein
MINSSIPLYTNKKIKSIKTTSFCVDDDPGHSTLHIEYYFNDYNAIKMTMRVHANMEKIDIFYELFEGMDPDEIKDCTLVLVKGNKKSVWHKFDNGVEDANGYVTYKSDKGTLSLHKNIVLSYDESILCKFDDGTNIFVKGIAEPILYTFGDGGDWDHRKNILLDQIHYTDYPEGVDIPAAQLECVKKVNTVGDKCRKRKNRKPRVKKTV